MFLDEIMLEIKCASIPDLLTKLADSGIAARNIKYIDLLTFRCNVHRKDLKLLNSILDKYGAGGKVLKRQGILLEISRLWKRPVLLFGMLIIFAFTLYLPRKILFVSVKGNERISTQQILEKAAANGVCFGTERKKIRSEKIKNALLGDISDLEWVGINTYGCLAVISVQERSERIGKENILLQTGIVAAKDGIITDVSITRGTALCKVGQAVKKGQLLVSGIADYGICVKETGTDGEVYALTGNVLRLISPRNAARKVDINQTKRRYSVILGKKLINFYKDSGISGSNCDRMYTQSYIVLPGGLQLPISLVVEEIRYYSMEQTLLLDSDMNWLTNFSEEYLLDHTVAGEILKKNVSVKFHDTYCELYGVYQCREMIGRYQNKGD